MGIMNPAFFILSVLIGTVILFYMFRKQYDRVIIPSNLLWEQLMNEYQASPWLDKLQRNLLLLLQLLIFIFIMLALVRPFWMTEGIAGESIILVIDRSASMSAEHNGVTRFEEAKNKLKDLVKKVNGQEVTLITTGNVPEIIVNRESDIKVIEQAIDKLEITYESNQMEKALKYASSMAINHDTSLFIYSDAVTQEDIMDLADSLFINVINVGEPGVNVSLQSFGVGGQAGEIIGISVIENQSDRKMNVTLQIQSENKVIFEQPLMINPGEQELVKIPDLPIKEYYKAAILAEDDYEIDNTMTTLYHSAPNKIYLLGDVSPFIVKGLENLGPEVIQLDKVDPDLEDLDGVVVVEDIPSEQWPKRPVFAITPENNLEVDLEESIQIVNDQILQYVQFDQVYVKSSFSNQNDLLAIASSGEIPLIEKGAVNGNPTIVVNFSIENSDWPLHTGFPIFLYNSFNWLTAQESFVGFFQPGERRWMNVDRENSVWKVFNEQGEFIQSYLLDEESFVAPHVPGLYQAVVGEKTIYFSVNLDEKEKSIPSEKSFSINHQNEHGVSDKNLRPYDNIWFWLILIALLLLFAEWEVMRRGNRA